MTQSARSSPPAGRPAPLAARSDVPLKDERRRPYKPPSLTYARAHAGTAGKLGNATETRFDNYGPS